MMTSLSEAFTRVAGHQALLTQKNSPKLLFVGGVVGMVGSTVLACRSTLKLEEVLEQAKGDLTAAKEITSSEYSESDRKKDIALIYGRSVGSVVKLYGPSVVLGAASIAMLTKSHNILEERNAALTAAYVAVDKAFGEYRERVVEKYGEQVDQELRYETEVVEIEQGGNKKAKKELRVGPNAPSMYAKFFDEHSSSWSVHPENNLLFLKNQQNYLNDLLQSRGHLFLNEVYTQLGLPHTSPGAIVGWIIGGDGDNYVDFGIWNNKNPSEGVRNFVNGREGSVLLDFNVDGVIYDKIEERGRGWLLDR